jgi:hypothetical protein
MLAHVEPRAFLSANQRSRTKPATLMCERPDGSDIEVMAKFSAFCEEGAVHLMREVVAACLAGDLGLPIPEPVIIDLSDDWIESVFDPTYRSKLMSSTKAAFGSKLVGSQFSIWNKGVMLNESNQAQAAAIFVFDAIIQNPDRRVDNPNCLVAGSQFRIIDHELAFSHGQVLFWKPPWVTGSLSLLQQPGNHIFRDGLRNRTIDYAPIRSAWGAVTNDMLVQYKAAVPLAWGVKADAVEAAVSLIRDARDRIDDCLVEVQRVLK